MDFDVDIIFKIAAIGIIVAVLNQVLIRAGREDQAMMTTLAGIIVVLIIIIQMVNEFFITVKTMFRLYKWTSSKLPPLLYAEWSQYL